MWQGLLAILPPIRVGKQLAGADRGARSGSYGDFEFQDHRHRTCSVTRWSGPGIQRSEQEISEFWPPSRACEEPIPGRSARSR